MSNEYLTARNTIRDGAREWFTQLRDSHPDERFYAFSFCFHDDFVGQSLWANSLEALQAKCDDPGDEEFTWNPAQWEYSSAFDQAWQALTEPDEDDNPYVDDVLLQFRATCLGVTLEALKDLADEGLWGRGSAGVLVFLTIWDSSESNWLTRESVRRINSPELFFAHPLEPSNWLGANVFTSQGKESGRRAARRRTELATVFHEMFGENPPPA